MKLRIATVLGPPTALLVVGAIAIASASATPGCGPPQTASPNGRAVYGTPCADEIVVTSPLVEEVFAGAGDDVIYATPNVEEVYGGEGNDVIFGGFSERTVTPGLDYEPSEPEEGGIDYETAPEGDALASGLRAFGARGAGPLATASNKVECTESPCYGGDGSQELFGGPGADQIFGQRGNDTLHGGSGADALYGGIGDDIGLGNDGYDLLSGGLGTDTLDGGDSGDIVRGDGTVDVIKDTGGSGTDTVSFASAVVPGFRGGIPIPGFPADGDGEERGVYIRMDGSPAPCGTSSCNNDARYGGGGDQIVVSDFETVIGSPFADYFVGSDGDDHFFGGGGTDVMIGNGGDDAFNGGAQSDYMDGGAGTDITFAGAGANNCSADVEYRTRCAGTAAEVHPRDQSKINIGYQTTTLLRRSFLWEPYYLVGSNSADNVNVRYVNTNSPDYQIRDYLIFTTQPGSAQFDTSDDVGQGCEYKPTEVKCPFFRANKVHGGVDAITLAGMGGDDRLNIAGNGTEWEPTITPVLLGGEGNDTLIGSDQTEDVLVDGNGYGNDTLYGHGLDDALLNNEGSDSLRAGTGSDLLLSATTCGGDTLQGAEGKKGDKDDVNNASWAQLPAYAGGVVADLRKRKAGSQFVEIIITSTTQKGTKQKGGKGKGGAIHYKGPACTTGVVDRLYNIDDLEGSSQADAFYGDAGDNNLLGRNGEDLFFGRAGEDRLAAQDGEHDQVGGGPGKDVCIYDKGVDSLTSCNP